jgi:hypothetical protein
MVTTFIHFDEVMFVRVPRALGTTTIISFLLIIIIIIIVVVII